MMTARRNLTAASENPGSFTLGSSVTWGANTIAIAACLNATLTLTSGTGTDNQSVCLGDMITTITYAITGNANGADAIGLPPGVSGNYNSGVYSISGTPSVSGTFNYTVFTTGTPPPCTEDTVFGSIIIHELPLVTWTNTLTNQCQNSTTYALSGGTPSGGVYSGPGVTGNNFDASAAGVGTHSLIYTYVDGNGCSASDTNTITVYPLPAVTCPAGFAVCIDEAPFALTGGSPSGGTYSGQGVSGGTFDPLAAGAGTWPITYSFTDGNGCTNFCVFNITVYPLPTVTCPADTAMCIDAPPFTLSGGSPQGGTYAGPGVAGGIFDPAAAGAGAHFITYTFTDTNSCAGSCQFQITVHALPAVTCPASFSACIDDPPVTLSGGSPAGGIYSGTGVSGGIFDPSVAGTGVHEITYTYTDPNGCINSCTFDITVHELPNVSCPDPFSICINAPPVTLSGGTPGGGYYSGTGVYNGVFYPAVAGTGTHTITYTYTDPITGCDSFCIFAIIVLPIPVGYADDQTICSGDTTYVTLSSSLPNTTFTWTASYYSGAAITGYSSCVSNCGNIIEQPLFNPTFSIPSNPSSGIPGIVKYTVTPEANGCIGIPFEVLVTVNPIPEFLLSHTISWNSNFQQDIIEICTGGTILNDNDIDILPLPANYYFNYSGWVFYYEYADSPNGPWITPPPGNWNPPGNPHSVNYQWTVGTELFTQPGIYYFRFTVINPLGCPSSSNLIELHVISTLTSEAGGPDFLCISNNPSPLLLEGSFVGGVSTTQKGGTWSITSLNPPNGPNTGTLSSYGFQTDPASVTYTPPADYAGTVILTLTSNDPDGTGTCDAITDDREILILPEGEFEACFAPANWPLINDPPVANGYFDDASAPCQLTLAGSDTLVLSGQEASTDIISCTGEGTFSFDWYYEAPANKPVWHVEDQQANYGSYGSTLSVNKPTNLSLGDLIIVTIHLRRPQPPIGVENITNNQGFIQIRKTTINGSSSSTRATVASFYKIAGESEPNMYYFTLPNSSTSQWRIMSSRITGQDPVNPIGNWRESTILSSPPNYWTININGSTLATTADNSILVAALSVVDIIQFPNSPLGMSTVYYYNGTSSYRTVARVAIETIETTGITGDRAFYWPRYGSVNQYNLSSAAQMFIINAPLIEEEDAAYYLVDGNPVFLSSTNGESGTANVPVIAGTEIGFRIGTTTNTGGRGKLIIYNLHAPDPYPIFDHCPYDTIVLGCNANPTKDTALILAGNATDACYANPVITVDSIINTAGCMATKSFLITATNDCGNSSECTVVFRYPSDTIKPLLTCPPDSLNIMADPGQNYATLSVLPPVYSDNCTATGDIIITWLMSGATMASGSGIIPVPYLFNVGTTFITYTATDECGNSNDCQFIVSVLPNDPPEITCPPDIIQSTDSSLCSAAISPGFPVLVSGTEPITYNWIMTGATNDAGNGPIAPDPYIFNQGITIITWIASNIAGSDTCLQSIEVLDDEAPLFTVPGPFEFCVMNIDTATWNGLLEPNTDIVPDRPDYYILEPGNTSLDPDTMSFSDNCCPTDSLTLAWTINFSTGQPPVSGTGLPSQYGQVTLWGDTNYNIVYHTISYILIDCHGNNSALRIATITIKPRPNVVKIF
jgi:hypothetical protein